MTTLDSTAATASFKMHRMLIDRVRCVFGNMMAESAHAAARSTAMPADAASNARIRCVDATALVMRDGAAGG
jgi:hypothetical protein